MSEEMIITIVTLAFICIIIWLVPWYLYKDAPRGDTWEALMERIQTKGQEPMWQCPEWSVKKNQWHDAQGSVLPEYDKEVIVIVKHGKSGHKVCFGHRPNPNGFIITQGGEKLYAKTYDSWNQPDVEWWLDMELPIKD